MIDNIEFLRRNLPVPLADPPVQAPLGYDVESWTAARPMCSDHQPDPWGDCSATHCRHEGNPWPCWRYQAALYGLAAAYRDPPADFAQIPRELRGTPVFLAARVHLARLHRVEQTARIAAVLRACGASWATTSRLLQASAAQVGARAAAHGLVLGTDPRRAPRGSV